MTGAEHIPRSIDHACLSCLLVSLMAYLVSPCGAIEAVPGQWISDKIVLGEGDPIIEIDLDQTSISGWCLDPAAPEDRRVSVSVSASSGWQLAVADNDPATAGHLTEWDGSAYLFRKLSNPLKVRAEREVTLPGGGVIQSGEDAYEGEIEVIFEQDVAWADELLPDNHSYRIVLTLTGSPSV